MVEAVVAEFIVTEEVCSKPAVASDAGWTTTSRKHNIYYSIITLSNKSLMKLNMKDTSGNGEVGHL